jgi:hypothetical protein
LPVSGSNACVFPDCRNPHHAERAPAMGTADGSAPSFSFFFTPAMSSACHALITPVLMYLRPARSRACHRFVLPMLITLP